MIGFDPVLLKRLIRILSEFQPDVVQMNGGRTLKYGILASCFLRKNRGVFIYRNIGEPQVWVRGLLRSILYKRILIPRVDGIIAISKEILPAVQKFYSPTAPLVYIPVAVAPEEMIPRRSREEIRAKTGTPLDALVMITVASFTKEKRLDRLLRVAKKVQAQVPDFFLWLIGGGPLRNELEQMVSALNLAHVVFAGVQEDIASYLLAADVMALTSDSEGLPGVLLEAGFLGLPAVATAVGGVGEAILHGKTGFVIEPDETKLAEAVLQLLQSPRLRQELGANAKDWVSTQFVMERIGAEYRNFYDTIKRISPAEAHS
jgi:glycosyltransferase involved in cell wall biosynthesis